MIEEFEKLQINVVQRKEDTLISFPFLGFIHIQTNSISLKESDFDMGTIVFSHQDYFSSIIEIECNLEEQFRLTFLNQDNITALDFNFYHEFDENELDEDEFEKAKQDTQIILSTLFNFVKDECIRLSNIKRNESRFKLD